MRLSTDEHGSCKLKDMVGTKMRKRLAAEMERTRIDQDKEKMFKARLDVQKYDFDFFIPISHTGMR